MDIGRLVLYLVPLVWSIAAQLVRVWPGRLMVLRVPLIGITIRVVEDAGIK